MAITVAVAGRHEGSIIAVFIDVGTPLNLCSHIWGTSTDREVAAAEHRLLRRGRQDKERAREHERDAQHRAPKASAHSSLLDR